MSRQWYPILALCVVIFVFNYLIPSDLNNWATSLNFSLDPILQDEVMQVETEWKHNDSEFGRRPFMISIMRYGTRWTGLPAPLLFTLVQFVGFLACLLALYRLTVYVWPEVDHPPLGLLPFILVFPNVFLFTAHAHTYDDLYQYLLLLLMLYGAVGHRPLLACVCAAAACVVRETSVLFLPVLAYLLWQHANWSVLKAVAATGLAALVSVLLLWWFVPADLAKETIAFTQTHRFLHWHANLSTYTRASETLVLTLVILAPFLAVAYYFRQEIRRRPVHRDLMYSALFLCIVNTLVVYIAAIAREARLLLLPLLPLFPVVGPIIVRECRNGALQWRQYSAGAWVTAFASALCITLAYQPSVGGTGYFYKLYVFCWVMAWSLILYYILSQADDRVKPVNTA